MALARDNVVGRVNINIVLVSSVLMLQLIALPTTANRVAKVEIFKEADCEGTPTTTFFLRSHTCHTFREQQGAIQVSNISDTTLVTYYNKMNCKASSVVFEGPGPGCLADTYKTLCGLFIQS